MKKRFSEEQIIGFLREAEAGLPVKELCRKHGFRFSGLLAWWFWLAAHVFFLIGFRNRMVVMIDWAQAYWSYQRSARIILGKDRAQ